MKRIVLVIAAMCIAVAGGLFAFTSRSKDQVLTFNGLGPVRIGMALSEAETALGTKLRTIYKDMPASCWFGRRADGVDPLVSYWVENDKIVRIDVEHYAWPDPKRSVPSIATERGIHIDSSTEEVKAAYSSKLAIAFHPQGNAGDENYLYMTLLSDDEQHGLLFEIWEGKVNQFRAGTAEAFYIEEPCA